MARRRELLLVAPDFPPTSGGGVFRPTKLVKYLGRLGWHTTVVCRHDPAPSSADAALLAQLPGETRVIRIPEPFADATTGIAAAAKTHLSHRSAGYRLLRTVRGAVRATYTTPDRLVIWALRAALRRGVGSDRPEVVVSSGPPHSAHIAGALLATRLRVPFVMDLRDEWSPNPFFHRTSAIRRALERSMESLCLLRASAVVLTTEPTLRLYHRRFPIVAHKSVLIPNGFDPEDLPSPAPPPPLTDGIVFAHAGSLLLKRDGRPFFEAFADAVAPGSFGGPPMRLLLLGALRAEQEEAARSSIGLERLRVAGFMPQRMALERLAASHVLVLITGTEEGGATAVAGKLYEYLALRRPILAVAPDGSPAFRLVQKLGVGAAADPRDPAALRVAITAVARLALDGSFHGAPAEVLARFDRRNHASVWDALLRGLIAERRC